MNDMAHLERLTSTDFDEQPLFYVEDHRGLPKIPEIQGQAQFLNLLKFNASTVLAFAIPNAGKRNPMKAKREGIHAGIFDTAITWEPRQSAWVEFKGFDTRGRPGSLSVDQVRWGNRMFCMGHSVACFFDPVAAVNWLRSKGCPIRNMEG